MHNHPSTTLEDANTIMQEQYLREDILKYKDPEDGVVKDGGKWYFIDADKFIGEEILHGAEVEEAVGGDFSTSLEMTQGGEVTLPTFPGACYQGIGIQFTVDGTEYDMTEENRSILENSVKAGIGIKWTYNPDRARKYGVSGSGSITVQVLDKKARKVSDVTMTIQV